MTPTGCCFPEHLTGGASACRTVVGRLCVTFNIPAVLSKYQINHSSENVLRCNSLIVILGISFCYQFYLIYFKNSLHIRAR